MNGNWKDLFSFNSRERNGILVLSTLIVLLIFFQYVMTLLPQEKVITDTVRLDAYVEQLRKDSAKLAAKRQLKYQEKFQKSNAYANKDPNTTNNLETQVVPQLFNPNLGSDDSWKAVGLSQAQINTIRKYLNKGGVFKIKSDVAKMYVIDDVSYNRMKPYLNLPEFVPQGATKKYKEAKFQNKSKPDKNRIDTVYVELNSADTTALKKLRGVGSYYARQIVYYRDKLGGFHSIEQLFEIERMREETVIKIMPFITIDTNLITKIHINSTSAVKMVQHPYITWNMAKIIQDHRDFDKRYRSIKELIDLRLLNEELYTKLVPYLEL